LTLGQGFLEALIEPNVDVVTCEVQCAVADGLITADGALRKVDTVICATGFNTSCRPRLRVVGDQGIGLAELWENSNDVEPYLAMAVPNFSNHLSKYLLPLEQNPDP
jgi:hypothetical protein